MSSIKAVLSSTLNREAKHDTLFYRLDSLSKVVKTADTCYKTLINWVLWHDMIKIARHLGRDEDTYPSFTEHTQTDDEDIRFNLALAFFSELFENTTDYGGNNYGMWLDDPSELPIKWQLVGGILAIESYAQWNEVWDAFEEFLLGGNTDLIKEINAHPKMFPPMEQMRSWFTIINK